MKLITTVVQTLVFVLGFLFLLVICGSYSAKWEVDRRKAVGSRLSNLAAAIEADPEDNSAYSELAEAGKGGKRWDRTAAFTEVRKCAPVIVADPDAQNLFTIHILPALRDGLTDHDSYIRGAAANASCEYGPLVAPLKETLLKVARDHPNEECGWRSVEAIGNIGADAVALIDSLRPLAHYNSFMAEEVEESVKKLIAAQRAGGLPLAN